MIGFRGQEKDEVILERSSPRSKPRIFATILSQSFSYNYPFILTALQSQRPGDKYVYRNIHSPTDTCQGWYSSLNQRDARKILVPSNPEVSLSYSAYISASPSIKIVSIHPFKVEKMIAARHFGFYNIMLHEVSAPVLK